MNIRQLLTTLMAMLRSQRGHNLLSFMFCTLLATALWMVMSINDEVQCDVRMPLVITNLPDTVTIVATPPQSVAVSLRTHGSQRIKLAWSGPPKMEIDYRLYRNTRAIYVSNTDLKAEARNALGGANIILVMPDSLVLPYTSRPGKALPITLDYAAEAGPKATIVGKPSLSIDSVKVFSTSHLPSSVRSVRTQRAVVNDLVKSTTVRVALIAPAGTRVIPDSVDVTFNVEPLIIKKMNVRVEPINVPADVRLITFPSCVDVKYMIAASDYHNSDPHVRVVADYNKINHHNPTRNIPLRIVEVSDNLTNVSLTTDSAEYVIEHR